MKVIFLIDTYVLIDCDVRRYVKKGEVFEVEVYDGVHKVKIDNKLVKLSLIRQSVKVFYTD